MQSRITVNFGVYEGYQPTQDVFDKGALVFLLKLCSKKNVILAIKTFNVFIQIYFFKPHAREEKKQKGQKTSKCLISPSLY